MSACEVRLPTLPGRAVLQTFASRWAWGSRNPSPSLFYMKLVFRELPTQDRKVRGPGLRKLRFSATEMHDNPTGPHTLSAPNNLSPEPYFDTKDLVGSNYCSANPERTQCQPVEKIQQTEAATVPLTSMAQVLHLPKSSGHGSSVSHSAAVVAGETGQAQRHSTDTAQRPVHTSLTGSLSTLAPLSAVES